MKKILFLFSFLFSLSGFSQSSSEQPFKRFYLGVGGSADVCFRTLKINGISNAVFEENVRYRNDNEIPKIAYSAGAQLGYMLKKRWGLELGIQYANLGYETKWKDISSSTNPSEYKKIRYNFHYILVPLKANVFLGERKLRFVAGAGLAAGFFLYERHTFLYTNLGDSKSNMNYIYNPFNLFVVANVGADLKLNERLHLRVEPYYRYGLLEILNSRISAHLWNAGFNIALNMELGS